MVQNNPYYKAYWLEKDQSLEHYGVKGMSWGNKKNKNLSGQSLLDTKVFDTPQWFRDNRGSSRGVNGIWNPETRTLRTADKTNNAVRNGVNAMKKALANIGKSFISELSNSAVSKGNSIIKKLFKSK